MRAALALLLLSGCATVGARGQWDPPACVTQCGARYWFRNGAPPMSCDAIEAGEAASFDALRHASKVDVANLCERLKDWSFQIGPAGYVTNCDIRLTWLERYEYGGLTHEEIHVSNNCSAHQEKHTGPFAGLLDWVAPNPIEDHYEWKTNGNQAAIDEAYGAWKP